MLKFNYILLIYVLFSIILPITIEIHFKNENKITNITADENWVIKNNIDKVILYSKDLNSMKSNL